jgi:hypothetical protein
MRTSTNIERNPPIDEIVGLINRHSPNSIEVLREEFPEQADELFREGITAGESEKQLGARKKACLTGLKVAIAVCENNIPLVKKKLKRANTLRLTSDIVTAISGASVVTVLASDFKKTVEYIVAVIAFVGTILSLITSYLTGVINPSAGNLYDFYKQLIECQVDAREIYNELKILEEPLADTNTTELITKGNALCKKVTILENSF